MDKVIKNLIREGKGRVFSYEEYIKYSEGLIGNTDPEEVGEKEKRKHNYRVLNQQRTKRINRTFRPKEELSNLFKNIKELQHWIIITEDWCGDSAQNIPYIINYTKNNPKIKISVILRDENIDLLESYIKEGNPRSIPKIIGFNERGEELFIWGPRPKAAQDLVSQLKAEGYSKEEFNKELHLWYSRNRGEELQKEFYAILKNIAA